MCPRRILVVRLGAMGDILHTLPAVACLRAAYPEASIAWICHPKWRDLIEQNPVVDEPIYLDRRSFASVLSAWRALRREAFDLVIDFQGLTKSALVAMLAKGGQRLGFDYSLVRETPAALFYHRHCRSEAAHVVERNLDLAALAGARDRAARTPLPPGRREGKLPGERFVLAAPLAGWVSKQWPLEHYAPLARRLRHEAGVLLVLNGAPAQEAALRQVEGVEIHTSSIAGLIDATRRSAAVLGLDSGPLHLAAALGKPGVALFGPTDPDRNGPWPQRITVLRANRAGTTYARESAIHPSMRELHPDVVFEALKARLKEELD